MFVFASASIKLSIKKKPFLMILNKDDRQVIQRLKKLLQEEFTDLIVDIICFGSRITKQNYESDFDILLLTNKPISWQKKRAIKNFVYDFGITTDIVFDPKIFTKNEYEVKYSYLPFIHEVRETGVSV